MSHATLRSSIGRASIRNSTLLTQNGGRPRSRLGPVRAARDDSDGFPNPFFYGKALAEVLNERMGTLAADTLAGIGTFEAEFRKALDEIQEEVAERAQQETGLRRGAGGSNGGRVAGNGDRRLQSGRTIGSRVDAAAAIDEDEVVDNLRAEIASARSILQQTKSAMSKRK